MQDSTDPVARAMQFAAILLEFGGAVLVATLFILIRRYALHRKYFATGTSAWLAMAVAIGAVATRYNFLGEMGGRELASRLVGACPPLRVIFMSGFVNDGELLVGLTDRRVRFLQKPFDIEELARVVRAEAEAPSS